MSSKYKKTLTLFLTVFIIQIFFIFSFPVASFAQGEEGASKPKLKLNVPIPGTAYDEAGKEYAIDIADYIGAIYQYSLGIVTLVAVLMIMIAGVVWLTAGGSPNKIKTSQNMIAGASIGLLLILFSYVLLNTVDPRLTKLEVPEIRKIEGIATSICCENDQGEVELVYGVNQCPSGKKKVDQGKCGGATGVGDICFTISDKEKCEASCEGCECHPMQESGVTETAEWVGRLTAAGLISGLAPGAVEKTVQLAWKGTTKAAKLLFGGKRALLTIPGGIGAFIAAGPEDQGERGLCYAEANRNVPAGGLCQENKHCASNICVTTTVGGLPIGTCGDGSVGSTCKTNTDCTAPESVCSEELFGGVKFCTDASGGSPCGNNSDCNSRNCQNYRCLEAGGNPDGATCVSDTECLSGICVNNQCSSGEANSRCYNNDDCVSAGGCDNNICRP